MLHRANAFAGRHPEVVEDTAGVEDGHESDCRDDHRSLENHEGQFVVGEMAVEAAPELGNTVGASDEDEDCSEEETFSS